MLDEKITELTKDTNFLPGFKFKNADLGTILSAFYDLAFAIGTFVAFFWFIWGAYEYLFAGGDKQKLAQARSRLTWSVIGLIFILVAFLIARWGAEVIQPRGGVPL